MRITSYMILNQQTRFLQRKIEQISKLNNRLASGAKSQKPSDDVIGTLRAMDYNLSININDQYKRNIDDAASHLEFTDKVFLSVSDSLSELKKLVIPGASGSLTADLGANAAETAAQFRDLIMDLSNSKFRDRYIFSGFRTDTQAYNPNTFNYQGDSGEINVLIDADVSLQINITGRDAFSYTLSAEDVVKLSDGKFIHYIPGAGTTVDVEIRDTDDTTVLDSFSFSNFIEMADTISTALANNDVPRLQAMLKPLNNASSKVLNNQAGVGAKQGRLQSQTDKIDYSNVDLKNALSDTVDADMPETITEILMAQASLEALRQSSAQVLSQSLLDFLR